MNIEKLNATITSSKVALSITILTFDYKVAFSFSIGVRKVLKGGSIFVFVFVIDDVDFDAFFNAAMAKELIDRTED